MTQPILRLVLAVGCFLLLVAAQPLQNPNRLVCPSTSSCSCNFIESDIEVDCPPFDPEITVRVQPKKYVQIECLTTSDKVYEKIPHMHLGNISMVRFKRCPPPPSGSSFHAVLGHLGIRNTRTLFIVNGGSSLVRQHLSGFKELDRLEINGNELSELPADLFDDVNKIRWLSLRSNSLHLPMNIFNSLENLVNLELGYNSLKSLTPGLFRHQLHLQNLNLWGNELKYLTRAELEGVSSIEILDLSANDLESLEAGVFEHLTNLTDINLSSNQLTSLPDGLFVTNLNLTRFRMLENKVAMETLPAGLFANLTLLESVQIKCGLTHLPSNLFEESFNLVNISLAGNQLRTLPKTLFEGLVHMFELDLSENRLQSLDDELFDALEGVHVLRLSGNQLESISE